MVIGYNFKTSGLIASGVNVKGEDFDTCLRKFRNSYGKDHNIDTENFTATPINISFQIV